MQTHAHRRARPIRSLGQTLRHPDTQSQTRIRTPGGRAGGWVAQTQTHIHTRNTNTHTHAASLWQPPRGSEMKREVPGAAAKQRSNPPKRQTNTRASKQTNTCTSKQRGPHALGDVARQRQRGPTQARATTGPVSDWTRQVLRLLGDATLDGLGPPPPLSSVPLSPLPLSSVPLSPLPLSPLPLSPLPLSR